MNTGELIISINNQQQKFLEEHSKILHNNLKNIINDFTPEEQAVINYILDNKDCEELYSYILIKKGKYVADKLYLNIIR